MVLTLKIGDSVMGEIKKNKGHKVPTGTIHSVNPSCSYPRPHPTPFIKGGSSTYPTLMEMGGGGEGLRIFATKRGLKTKSRWRGGGGGLSLEMEVPYYIEVVLEIPHDAA